MFQPAFQQTQPAKVSISFVHPGSGPFPLRCVPESLRFGILSVWLRLAWAYITQRMNPTAPLAGLLHPLTSAK